MSDEKQSNYLPLTGLSNDECVPAASETIKPSLAEDKKGVSSSAPQHPRTKTRHRFPDDRKPTWVGYDGSSVWWDPKTNPLDDLIVKSTQTPDGSYIYTLDANSVIHVWKVDKGQELLNNQAVVYHRAEEYKLFYDWTMYVPQCDSVSYPKQYNMCTRLSRVDMQSGPPQPGILTSLLSSVFSSVKKTPSAIETVHQSQPDGLVTFSPFCDRDSSIHGHRVGVWDFSATPIEDWYMSTTRLYILHRRSDLPTSFLSIGHVEPSGVVALNSKEDITSARLSLGWIDLSNGQYTHLFDVPWKHDSNFWTTQLGLSIICSPDEQLMCVASQGRELNVYNLNSQQCVCTIKEPHFSFLVRMAFSQDNRWLFVVNSRLHIYDLSEESPTPKWTSPNGVEYNYSSDCDGCTTRAKPYLYVSKDGTTLYLHGPHYRGAKLDIRHVGEGQWWPLQLKLVNL